MRIYFLRHAAALSGGDDSERQLSPDGMEDSRRLSRFLKQAGIVFDAAYSSPLIRARQTAELVLETTNATSPIQLQVTEALLNEASDFDEWLRELPEQKHILLTGHAPSMAERLCRLLGIPDAGVLKLPKCGLACVNSEDRREARLKFFLTPKVV